MTFSNSRPTNEQDFERLCLKLLREHWKSPLLELYARRGEKQFGVDIIDMSGATPLRAAQCKLHDENKSITPAEIRGEVNKAKTFPFPLNFYLIATTAKVSGEAQNAVIEINREHAGSGLFEVHLMGWTQLEELLEKYTDIRDEIYGGASALAVQRIEEGMSVIAAKMIPRFTDDKDDSFHAEIDDAKTWIDQHEYQMARLWLERVQRRHWDQLNSRHKFRLLSNLAVVWFCDGDYEKSATLYLQAKTFQPEDEIAQINEAFAYQLLRQMDKAHSLAAELVARYPHSSRLISVFVRSAPKSMTLEEIVSSVPIALRQDAEVAVALFACALEDQKLDVAEGYARVATKSGPSLSFPFVALADVLMRRDVIENWEKSAGTGQLSDKRLAEAEECLDVAVENARNEKLNIRVAGALVARARARTLRGKKDMAGKDILEAFSLAPNDPAVLGAYCEILEGNGDLTGAIEILQRALTIEPVPAGKFHLILLLRKRGASTDAQEIISISLELVSGEEKFLPGFREYIAEMALETFAKEKRWPEADTFLQRIPAEKVSKVGMNTLLARLYRLKGESENAINAAVTALDAIGASTTISDMRSLALLLSDLGKYVDALPLWERIADPKIADGDTRQLLDSAHRLERHDVLLKTFESLRTAGIADQEFLDYELQLLEMYDPQKAAAVMQEQLRRHEDSTLRLRLSVLGLRLARADLMTSNIENMPKAIEATPQIGMAVVHVLRAAGRPNDAVVYSYEVLRRNFSDPEAHRTYMASLLPLDTSPDIPKPACVAPGSAVCFVEEHDDKTHWIIVEDGSDPDSRLGEFPPEHPLCKTVMGKRIGDGFVLAHGSVSDRTATIRDVISKYTYRYQDCLKEFQVRFQEARDVQMIRVMSDPSKPETLDITAISRSLEQRQKAVQEVQAIYQSQPVTLHMFGRQFGENAFTALQNLASNADVKIKCCAGSIEEREESSKALSVCNTVVLDLTAVATLFMMRRLAILEHWPTDLVVSPDTLAEIKKLISEERRGDPEGRAVITKSEKGLAVIQQTKEQKQDYLAQLLELEEVIERKCKIVPSTLLASLDKERRATLIQGFGQYGAESMMLGALPGHVLWTDDQVQAGIARAEYGVMRIWTQLALATRADVGAMTPSEYCEVSAKLAGSRYSFTGVNALILKHAAMLADWQVTKWPFKQNLEIFSDNTVDDTAALQLCADLFVILYREPLLPETLAIITVKTLENFAKRGKGMVAIRSLRKALPGLFGLNVVGQAAAIRTMDAWLDSKVLMG